MLSGRYKTDEEQYMWLETYLKANYGKVFIPAKMVEEYNSLKRKLGK